MSERILHLWEGEDAPKGVRILRIIGREDVPTGNGTNWRTRYIVAASSPPAPCDCRDRCGDDGNNEGDGVCKGLPAPPREPLVEVVMVPRRSM